MLQLAYWASQRDALMAQVEFHTTMKKTVDAFQRSLVSPPKPQPKQFVPVLAKKYPSFGIRLRQSEKDGVGIEDKDSTDVEDGA